MFVITGSIQYHPLPYNIVGGKQHVTKKACQNSEHMANTPRLYSYYTHSYYIEHFFSAVNKPTYSK